MSDYAKSVKLVTGRIMMNVINACALRKECEMDGKEDRREVEGTRWRLELKLMSLLVMEQR